MVEEKGSKAMSRRAVQGHHISYNPEVKVAVFQGEHEILTKIRWYEKNSVSKGFITALKTWISENEDRAIDLE